MVKNLFFMGILSTLTVGNLACRALTCENTPNLKYVGDEGLTALSFPLQGSGQGLQVIDDKIYLYADTETGSIYELNTSLEPTGWVGHFTVGETDLIPHPTGIAYKAGYPTFVGYGGSIHEINWDLFLEDGNLDRALIKTIADDAAHSGTRPEYVLYNDKWYVATSDYISPSGSEVRLMDPALLSAASKTSAPGVVAHRFPVSDFVQDIHWSESLNRLVLIQNIEEWHGWKFSLIDLNTNQTSTVCFSGVASELEGYATFSDGREVFLTGETHNNLFVTDSLAEGILP